LHTRQPQQKKTSGSKYASEASIERGETIRRRVAPGEEQIQEEYTEERSMLAGERGQALHSFNARLLQCKCILNYTKCQYKQVVSSY
jgi:hypothetical protein